MTVRSTPAPPATRKPRPAKRAPKGTRPGVVAVGASAGGLQALEGLFKGLPEEFPAPILVVLHLDPDHLSNAAALLQRHTKLKVKQAVAGARPAAGTIHIARPGHHLELVRGKLVLSKGAPVNFSRPSIDRLFESVAKEHGENAIAVVLSGTGNDGSAGVVAVKAAGGRAVAEHRSSATYSAMPEAAGHAGVDAVLPVGQIGMYLLRALRLEPTIVPAATWRRILRLVQQRSGTDFSGYRATTLQRRLQKRMDATHQDVAGYARLLAKDPAEIDRLHSAFLIKVSSFRRDPDAWRDLLAKVIRPVMKAVEPGREVRVWSAGCATGEEAYTLALMLCDAARDPSVRVKVFATDIDEEALAIGRLGIYTDTQLQGLTSAQRKRHFVPHGSSWKASRLLRRQVVFGRHDLLRDPPLSGMDLVVCRNVLIYFDATQKQETLSRLCYALRAGGHIFFGRSEGARPPAADFLRVAGRSAIFQRLQASYVLPSEAPAGQAGSGEIDRESKRGGQKVVAEAAFQHLLLQSASVILLAVGADRRITLWNAAAHAFFGLDARAAIGMPLYEALPDLAADKLGTAIQGALRDRHAVQVTDVAYAPRGKMPRSLDLDCIPFNAVGPDDGVLLVGTNVTTRSQAEDRQARLVSELHRASNDATKLNEALMATNEEMETVNEELQSTSEEQQTLNEELQSRNEELETVNEELQSTNEELSTLSEDVRIRSEEAERATMFLSTLLDAGKDAMVGCSGKGTITFWSRLAGKRFMLSGAQAVGQDLFAIVPLLDTPALRKAVAGLGRKKPNHEEVEVRRGRTALRITVIHAVDDKGRRQGCLLRIRDVEAPPKAPKRAASKRKA